MDQLWGNFLVTLNGGDYQTWKLSNKMSALRFNLINSHMTEISFPGEVNQKTIYDQRTSGEMFLIKSHRDQTGLS